MRSLLILILVGFTVGIALGFMNVQFNFWIFVVLLIIAFFALSYRDIRYMFLSKDVDKIEKYLKKKSHEPYYGFILELANGNLPEANRQLEELDRKWKGKKTAIFRAQYYLRMKNLAKAKEEVAFIDQVEIRNYVRATIAVEEKDTRTVEELKPMLRKDWMKLVIETEQALKRKNYVLAKEKKEEALASTKGLQYFMIYKEYEKV